MNQPLVTIGLPVFNGEKYLNAAIESLLGQDYENVELVISDNASTDRTPEIIKSWAENDDRVRPFRNLENLGAAANFNKVLELANGEYFRWAGHDDRLAPDMVSKCLSALESAGSRCVLVYPQTMIIDGSGDEIGLYDNRLDLRHESATERLRQFIRNYKRANPIFGLMRTQAIKEVGGLPAYHSGDIVMMADLVLRGSFEEIPEPLFQRRIHEDMSWKAMSTPEGFATWFDPENEPLVVFPMWRLWREFLKSVFCSPLIGEERRKALAVVLMEWPRRHHKRLRGEIIRIPRVLARGILKAQYSR